MADPPAQPDLSMEEILAVIRRNIAEDSRAPTRRPAPPPEAPGIVELTDIVDDDDVFPLVDALDPEPPPAEAEPAAPAAASAIPSAAPSPAAPSAAPAATPAAAVTTRSLEDLVAELLRPVLREWLDQHLPAVIERVVREELPRHPPKPQ